MSSSDVIFEKWNGMIDDDFLRTIRTTFDLPVQDGYVYAAGTFQITLSQVQGDIESGNFKWAYWSADQQKIPISDADISAYTSIFASTTDTAKTLKSFDANAKKGSPRALVAPYLISTRLYPSSLKVSKLKKAHLNPYYDVWCWTCHNTGFLGPLRDATYASPANASLTHPMVPVLYHHFGCVCPSFEALSIIAQLKTSTGAEGVLEMASGNGYWTYMLRRMGVQTIAVDNMDAKWRTIWISDTIKTNGVDYMRKNEGARACVLLMVYMVTRGDFTKQVLKSYKGDTIVIAGTQNANRFTSFQEVTVEEYFEQEMKDWELVVMIALPSFAGKDEGMFVFQRKSVIHS